MGHPWLAMGAWDEGYRGACRADRRVSGDRVSVINLLNLESCRSYLKHPQIC